MERKRNHKVALGMTVATLLVGIQLGTASDLGAASPHQLAQIQKMVAANRIDELVAFIEKNPRLAHGTGPLAEELSSLMDAVSKGAAFSFSGDVAGKASSAGFSSSSIY